MNSDELRAALLSGDLSRPRLTWYDAHSGERIDLSGKTLANWVAKAANWLDLEMALAPGDVLGLTIPGDHWRAIYWSLAAWTRGLSVIPGTDADAVVGLVGQPDAADLAEPAAALARSPLQAMSDAMPPPAGPEPTGAAQLPADLPAESRVLLGDQTADQIAALTAGLIGHGCSVLVVRGADAQARDAVRAAEAVNIVL
ncbi:TIGR03089 family protein [Flexivirga caeni]|uniref:TIGR03089 family protein n=1 Tax=Flexivirga caeni TaxID=2294115 RepID=A0A3M9MCA3_9MICO|nr:TIGR03089 family protein [Flexivirga caeni]RNI23166.1 hypothetical protein EFY87_06930 [Flexivirga caeni]